MQQHETTEQTQDNIDMLDNKPVKIANGSDIYFHRNGIGGQPFWTVKFTYGQLNMVATIGVEEDSVILSSCRVLCLGRGNARPEEVVESLWRGDKFAPILVRQMSAIFDTEGFNPLQRTVRNVRSD